MCVLQYIDSTKSFRKPDSFFVIFSGANKGAKASKHTIARWLSLAISLAYVVSRLEVPEGIRAHSTRVMAALQVERAGATSE